MTRKAIAIHGMLKIPNPVVAFLLICLGFIGFWLIFTWFFQIEESSAGLGVILFDQGLEQIYSPKKAIVERWFFEEGDEYKKGDVLALLKPLQEFSEKSTELIAQDNKQIAEIIAYPGSLVELGQGLAIVTSKADVKNDLELLGFVSSLDGKKLSSGMKVKVFPTTVDKQHFGFMWGEVKKLGKLPISKASLSSLIKIPELAKYIRQELKAEPFLVKISLNKDEAHKTGYKWQGAGPDFTLDSGTIASFGVIQDQKPLLFSLWPALKSYVGFFEARDVY